MTTLVLTLVGSDRAGIVAAVASAVDAAGGNWEDSELAELSGAFAGIVQVSVPAAGAESLRTALEDLPGLITVAVAATPSTPASAVREITLQVLGNDRPGIVREISAALSARTVSIERMATQTRDAAMSGGRLFEATITASVPEGVDIAVVRDDLERIAAEIQVDVTLAD
ncbi:glycine cleavage system protein R [Microbacterium sp. RD1]|uniref:glycine cleavage system protein R n=1 Tax=Microbacterium sp. RD1 TaxID=3457313 RepID=UPI003FA576BB